MTYPCANCNRDEGSPICLGDERCQYGARFIAVARASQSANGKSESAPALGPDEFIGKAQINGHWYSGKHMVRVARITYDGSTCTVPLSALVDMLGEGETYQVCVTSMRKAEFDRLEEFQGW